MDYEKGMLLHSDCNGMTMYILPLCGEQFKDECKKICEIAEAAYEEWMEGTERTEDTCIGDWIEIELGEHGYDSGIDYYLFADVNWD